MTAQFLEPGGVAQEINQLAHLFLGLFDAGDIFKGKYTGYYCVSCEGFKQEKDLEDGLCPVHRTKPDWIEEENKEAGRRMAHPVETDSAPRPTYLRTALRDTSSMNAPLVIIRLISSRMPRTTRQCDAEPTPHAEAS